MVLCSSTPATLGMKISYINLGCAVFSFPASNLPSYVQSITRWKSRFFAVCSPQSIINKVRRMLSASLYCISYFFAMMEPWRIPSIALSWTSSNHTTNRLTSNTGLKSMVVKCKLGIEKTSSFMKYTLLTTENLPQKTWAILLKLKHLLYGQGSENSYPRKPLQVLISKKHFTLEKELSLAV